MVKGMQIMEKKQRVLLVHNYYQIGGGEYTVFENMLLGQHEKGGVSIAEISK